MGWKGERRKEEEIRERGREKEKGGEDDGREGIWGKGEEKNYEKRR